MSTEKIETAVHVKVPPEAFFRVLSDRTYQIPNMSPAIIKNVTLVEGEWGKEGSIIVWNYVLDGKDRVAKEFVDSIDRENNSITFRVMEGDLFDLYRVFLYTVKVTADREYGGSVVHWVLEYEKLRADVPDPHTMLYLTIEMSKDIEHHILQS